jgi:hypothetical protein
MSLPGRIVRLSERIYLASLSRTLNIDENLTSSNTQTPQRSRSRLWTTGSVSYSCLCKRIKRNMSLDTYNPRAKQDVCKVLP